MWEKTFLLLHVMEAVMAPPCWQGATFPEAVVSPAVESSGIIHVAGVTSLPQCVAACCDLPGYDLAWVFKGRCYILSCQQEANCQPQVRPGSDSVLAFLQRSSSPQTLLLQSLVRGEEYGGGWGPGRDLEALKGLALFDGTQPDFSDPRILDVEYSEGGSEAGRAPGDASQITSEAGSETTPKQNSVTQINPTFLEMLGQGDENRTEPPTVSSAAAEEGMKSWSSSGSTTLKPQDSIPRNVVTSHHDIITIAEAGEIKQVYLEPVCRLSVAGPPLAPSLGNPVDLTTARLLLEPTSPSDVSSTTDLLRFLQSQTPTTIPLLQDLTSDPPGTSSAVSTPITNSVEVSGSNRPPTAIVGPDRKLFLPLSSILLNGSSSTDDRSISSYHWEVVRGCPGLKLEDADQAVAMLTGIQAGYYTFRLTVSDQQGAMDSALLTVRVQEARTPTPPVAHASGSHVLTLPNNSLVLRGSVTGGDQTQVHFLWTRDNQSPAAGLVLFGSGTRAWLYLSDLVEGTYLFQLKVTDALGRSNTATATVEVRPEPGGSEQVELELLVPVSQVSVAQRDTVVRQLAALIHVLDQDIQVRVLQERTHLSSVLRFSVRGPSGPVSASKLAVMLRKQLLREKSDYLLFRVLRIDTVVCQLSCSGQGQCDPITKQCVCDPFWTENLIRRYLGDGESNCEWRVLFVVLSSFLLMVSILSLSWTFICCSRRGRRAKGRRRTRYTILDDMDEQERLELRPKFCIKHRSTEHNSSLMMSESELDSEQDAIFSRNRTSAQATLLRGT
nr:dyslexia-associated protein KIAA0319 homolog isoform X1 [Nothobranchius furzeri]